MSTDLERVSLSSTTAAAANSGGSVGGRALSTNVRKLHNSLNLLINDFEREQFIHCLNVYHAKRNVFDLVQTLRVILDTASKRQLLPMLRLVIPRSDQLLFDQYTSEGLYLKTDSSGEAEGFGETVDVSRGGVSVAETTHFISPQHHHHPPLLFPEDFSTAADGTVPLAPLMPFGEMRQVTLTRSRSHEGLGFSIRGGSEHGVGIYVSLVEPSSSAEREGLKVGDQIVTVNDMLFDTVTHIEAVKVLKGCKRLAMSVCSVGRIPGGYMSNHVYSWVDPRGRGVSPPPDMPEGTRRCHDMEERTVNLNMDDGRSLGLMIRGGAEYGLGIYITGVDPGSAADVGALKVGDQILEVNGCSFVTISHDEAVHILKMGHQLLMRVRDVGRLPHARTVVDETKWINSPPIAESAATAICNSVSVSANASACSTRPSSARATPVLGKPLVCRGVGPPGSQVFLEEQAYLLLTEPERQTMVYYLQEYQEGHIGVQPLTMALFELFNTHAKLSLLSEVRGLVAPQDLELYDGLVLHREREAHKGWHGGLGVPHPQSHCIHEAPTGHTSPSKNDISAGGRIGEDLEENTDALQNVTLEEDHCSCDHPLSFKPQARPSSMREPTRRLHSARPGQSASGVSFTGPTRLFRECPHNKPVTSLPGTHQGSPNSTRHIRPSTARHTSLTSLRHTCQNPPYPPASDHHHHHHQQQQQAHPAHHHHNQHLFQSQHNRPGSERHTCPGFLHHREAATSPPRPEAPVKLSSRTSSYEKSSVQARSSAASSNSATPMASPHLSPFPSPCPSPCPSLVVPPPPPSSPLKQPCSPSPNQRGIVGTDGNRLTADGRTQPQQRGATLSQLSDSGQTLSEDSGVDIAEAGGLSKDGSPRPTKGPQQGQPEPSGVHGAPQTSRQTSPSPALSPVLVRVAKNANTLGIAIEGGANTRQPMPRIVTIQKGGSAHRCGQLRVGQVILEVNGVSLRGQEHKDAARIIAEAFKTKEMDHIDFLVAELSQAHLPGH